jgi:hypothetical protein
MFMRPSRRIAAIGVLVLAAHVSAFAQGSGGKTDPPKTDPPKTDPPKTDPPKTDPKAGASDRMPAEVVAAQDFLLTTYPELAEHQLALYLRLDGDVVLASIEDAPVSTSHDKTVAAVADRPAPLIVATLAFDAQGQLLRYAGHGALLEETRNTQLLTQINDHPTWKDSDLDAWLIEAGGPTTVTGTPPPAVSRAATQPWQTFLGSAAKADRTTFQWKRDATAPALASTGAPAWITETTATSKDGKPLRYRLEFEPFGGKLVGVVRQ